MPKILFIDQPSGCTATGVVHVISRFDRKSLQRIIEKYYERSSRARLSYAWRNIMKKYCKNVDITDLKFITTAVYTCIDDKFLRHDTLDLLAETVGFTSNQIYYLIYRLGKFVVYPIIDLLAKDIQDELKTKSVKFKEIWYKTKVDPSSFKIREIGIQNVKQQIYDYIAVNALECMKGMVGFHQYASIKGRGQLKGAKRISRWMRNKNLRYAAKADIKKCYPSINHDKLMNFLRKHIKNEPLLYLIQLLINSFKKGLSIGSYLSQFLCNLYLSKLYHEIHENMYKVRKQNNGTTKRVKLVKKCLMYMDDILIIGTSSKDVHKAMRLIVKYAKEELGLTIKPDWVVFKIPFVDHKSLDKIFIDMMGIRIYRKHLAIRDYVFIRIRRAFIRTADRIKRKAVIPISYARRIVSYNGIISNTSNYKFRQKYGASKIFRLCKSVVRKYDKCKSKVCRPTRFCYCS